jgi:hypothetical protein
VDSLAGVPGRRSAPGRRTPDRPNWSGEGRGQPSSPFSPRTTVREVCLQLGGVVER